MFYYIFVFCCYVCFRMFWYYMECFGIPAKEKNKGDFTPLYFYSTKMSLATVRDLVLSVRWRLTNTASL